MKRNTFNIQTTKNEIIMILIGINYVGTKFMLSNCYHNILSMRNLILSNINVKQQNIYVLTDGISKAIYPSYMNILTTLNKILLMIKLNPNINYTIFFHYSGHGGELISGNTEKSIISADLKPITDEYLNNVFLSQLSNNVKLIATVDCCFNNTVFDTCIMNKLTMAKICLISFHIPDSQDYNVQTSGLITDAIIQSIIKNKNATLSQLSNMCNEYLNKYLVQSPLLISTDDDLLNQSFFS